MRKRRARAIVRAEVGAGVPYLDNRYNVRDKPLRYFPYVRNLHCGGPNILLIRTAGVLPYSTPHIAKRRKYDIVFRININLPLNRKFLLICKYKRVCDIRNTQRGAGGENPNLSGRGRRAVAAGAAVSNGWVAFAAS